MTTHTVPLAGSYTLDPERTTIRCDGKAMLGLSAVHGTFSLITGRVTISEDPAAATAEARIAAGSFASGNSMRDAHVASRALLDAETYPEITFTGTGARSDGAAGWVLTGSVTAHGTTQPADVSISEARSADGVVRFRATATVDRFSFGVTRMRLRVGHTMHLIIDATGVPA
jgi:polyisoprenoid-binding protein YceI